MSRTVHVHLNDQEAYLFDSYAKAHGQSLENLLKETLMAHIENEVDYGIIQEYENAKKTKDIQFYTHDDVKNIVQG
ncbi:hypothetical protein EF384_09365 [Aerococcus agrisoli]|uniref:CopG family transcriptional regulator n=1 Tax=Aerococcus agrisoli TaxID=2487350 RepID=A0A3N4G9A5_9LACT|nr:DUF6290 family protein [Aerococcus agrisoli]RPA55541.1 hypothetical protein EF384_09365 [Aerococcus agrisoli]